MSVHDKRLLWEHIWRPNNSKIKKDADRVTSTLARCSLPFEFTDEIRESVLAIMQCLTMLDAIGGNIHIRCLGVIANRMACLETTIRLSKAVLHQQDGIHSLHAACKIIHGMMSPVMLDVVALTKSKCFVAKEEWYKPVIRAWENQLEPLLLDR